MVQIATQIVVAFAIAAAAVVWFLALADVARRPEWEFPRRWPETSDRLVWILVVLFGNFAGALAYYVLVMRPYPRRR